MTVGYRRDFLMFGQGRTNCCASVITHLRKKVVAQKKLEPEGLQREAARPGAGTAGAVVGLGRSPAAFPAAVGVAAMARGCAAAGQRQAQRWSQSGQPRRQALPSSPPLILTEPGRSGGSPTVLQQHDGTSGCMKMKEDCYPRGRSRREWGPSEDLWPVEKAAHAGAIFSGFQPGSTRNKWKLLHGKLTEVIKHTSFGKDRPSDCCGSLLWKKLVRLKSSTDKISETYTTGG
ncbi:uncharacterized protein LOC127468952 isoform X2 [Manacus candei]|uniref:uncharacterized protein LOC127468952 isoform X2 n=1 Tax=Manacus candei TaxID=415023 RepID=UPI002227281A|nr:uncharacterized protein LOC127468952 isoform X2 [Manacus candei]